MNNQITMQKMKTITFGMLLFMQQRTSSKPSQKSCAVSILQCLMMTVYVIDQNSTQ